MSFDRLTTYALSLIKAERQRDILGALRLLRDIRRDQCTDALIGQLVRIAICLLADLFEDDDEDIDAFLESWLSDLQTDNPGEAT